MTAILSSAVMVYFAGQLLGWWQLSVKTYLTAIVASVIIPSLLLWPLFDAAERRKHDTPLLRWFVLLLAFTLSGIVLFFLV